MSKISWKEEKSSAPEEVYFNLFRHYLRDPNRYPLIERKEQEYFHDLKDKYIMDASDIVNYALGNMDDGWPIGVFRLGINTLKGEVSIP